MLSSTSEYALKAVMYLARHGGDQPVRAHEMADALNIPRNYLAKILHELTRTGLLRSTRGKRGGFQLSQPASGISLLSIVNKFDRVESHRTCLLGRTECSDRHACTAHRRWKLLSDQMATFLRDTTVAALLEEAEQAA